MSLPADGSASRNLRGDGPLARALRHALILALLILGLATAGGPGAAQDAPPAPPPEWEATLNAGKELVANAETPTEALEGMRDQLLRLRSGAIALEASANAQVAEINARIAELGPAPAEGASETPEVATRRHALSAELSDAQAPLLAAQDASRRADTLIREVDRIVRGRFTAQLRSRGPSPLDPTRWPETAGSIVGNFARIHADVAAGFSNPGTRSILLRRVPLDLLLAMIGVAIVFVIRRRLTAWVEKRLDKAQSPRTIALLVALRNFSRLIVPAAGAGMIFAALDPARLTNPGASSAFFELPWFLIAVIGASWLGHSVFAPKLPAYRLAPLRDDMAATGARVTLGLGLIMGAALLASRYLLEWDLSRAALATMVFPLFILGSLLLWRMSRVLRAILAGVAEWEAAHPTMERVGPLSLGLLNVVRRALLIVAAVTPLLAAAGFLAAASYLMFSTIATLALAGAAMVVFNLTTTLLGGFSAPAGGEGAPKGMGLAREGLMPVAVVSLIGLLCLPALALIWGARISDIAGVWYLVRDGVTYGGMRISLGMVTTFALVFGLLYGATRIVQSILRNTVLPRTRMDAGGKNALTTGVGYIGFMIAAVAAVSSTGLDLSSLAFVAGALSVGIGFGMQNVVSNFVSGIILLVERPIKEGDWIEVGGFAGYVRRISVRSTVVETFDRASVILPNTDLIAGTVLNRTHSGLSGRLQVPVAVALDTDPRKVERLLLEIAENYPLSLNEPSPRVLLMEIGPDAFLFEIRCWLRDVNFSLSAKSDMNFEILERFAAEGIRLQPYGREAWVSAHHTPAPPPGPAAPDRPPGGLTPASLG